MKALQKVYEVGGTSLSSIQDAEVQCSINRAAERKAAEELRNSSLYLEHFKKYPFDFFGLWWRVNSVVNSSFDKPRISYFYRF